MVYPYLDRECGCVTVTRVVYNKVHIVFIFTLHKATYIWIFFSINSGRAGDVLIFSGS